MAITQVTCTITICFGCFLLSTLFSFQCPWHHYLALGPYSPPLPTHAHLLEQKLPNSMPLPWPCSSNRRVVPSSTFIRHRTIVGRAPTHDSGLYLTTKNVHVVKLSKRRAFSLVSSFFWCRRSRHPHRTSVSVCEELPSPNRNVSRLHRSMV